MVSGKGGLFRDDAGMRAYLFGKSSLDLSLTPYILQLHWSPKGEKQNFNILGKKHTGDHPYHLRIKRGDQLCKTQKITK